MNKVLAALLLNAALVGGAITTGCAVRGEARLRYYDRDHEDWHSWDDREDHEYRRFLNDHHRDYRDFRELNDKEKSDYWKWRHDNSRGGGG